METGMVIDIIEKFYFNKQSKKYMHLSFLKFSFNPVRVFRDQAEYELKLKTSHYLKFLVLRFRVIKGQK